jgi:SAM-dependent methyltransferase
MSAKLTWSAPERNKQPILEVLERVSPRPGTLLEIASGTGQHAAHFAARLPELVYQPTDIDDSNLASIAAWQREAALPNLLPPLRLDVCAATWPIAEVEVVYNANLVHIAPWECAEGLFRGAARHLAPGGLLFVYGPFRIGGTHTAPSNQSFDEDLRRRDPRFGVRDLEDIVALATQHGLRLEERVPMPANNQSLLFRRASRGAS